MPAHLCSVFVKNLFVGVVAEAYAANYSRCARVCRLLSLFGTPFISLCTRSLTSTANLDDVQVKWLLVYKRIADNMPQPRYEPPCLSLCLYLSVSVCALFSLISVSLSFGSVLHHVQAAALAADDE